MFSTPGISRTRVLLSGFVLVLLLVAQGSPVLADSRQSGDGWTIQLESFSSQERAKDAFQSLTKRLPAGIAALMRIEHIPPYYALRLAAFSDRPSAEALLATVQEFLPRATLLEAVPRPERIVEGAAAEPASKAASQVPSPILSEDIAKEEAQEASAPQPEAKSAQDAAQPTATSAPESASRGGQGEAARPASAATAPVDVAPKAQASGGAQATTTAPEKDAPDEESPGAVTPGLRTWQDVALGFLPFALITLLLAGLLVYIVRRAMTHHDDASGRGDTSAPEADAPAAAAPPAPRIPGAPPALAPELEDVLASNIGELSQAEGNLAALGTKARTLFVTSCFNGEGKTTAAISMAHALTINGLSKVLLIDGNPRSHRLHELYAMDAAPGLLELIHGTRTVSETAHETKYPHVFVMPFGKRNGERPNLLKDNRLRDVLGMLREHFDYVLMDGHSAMASSDAVMVAGCFEGTLLVVECERTKWEVVQMTAEKIRMVGGQVLGTILNRRRYYIPRFLYRIL